MKSHSFDLKLCKKYFQYLKSATVSEKLNMFLKLSNKSANCKLLPVKKLRNYGNRSKFSASISTKSRQTEENLLTLVPRLVKQNTR